ncbi:anti-RNA polymerase sigma factor SigE [Yersinia frederiksenii]|uniref:Anti-sigma-E factor RseA n=2 Tax=Yersinia frederiksenii TaxID=29484 RepID=A0A380PSQ1_YERFR|nr:anti-sigma-E factor RseA [Yersinia frederiksenii]ATM94815.1 anti-sigma-E factor RseA [Yersinia frederiksenii]EEQ15461.1 Sigma-E factor negative regulatory protein [Yersinia frederiksenii ATCC 33641]KGA47539.1 sigma-E factor negative regulatory protein [Yersinia frederiksenii ATCC 33641]MDN0120559.1 anti-sigma-E factor RseA [Yersinia frederiksenii]CFR10375.1 anti-RNA polymerase sigma factor SigE [Yersinia frederiksenii]
MQKEKLSALMDGETLDSELIGSLSKDKTLQQSWQSYHLIRDTLRGDVGEVLHLDIASRVAEALKKEPARFVPIAVPESQPQPHVWQKMPFWQKVRPWASQLTQVGVAACVSLAVIVGVQQYNQPASSNLQSEAPAFNTLPMMGKASPVSFGAPAGDSLDKTQVGGEQRHLVNMLTQLQDFELQRRLPQTDVLQESSSTTKIMSQVPGNQSFGTKQ